MCLCIYSLPIFSFHVLAGIPGLDFLYHWATLPKTVANLNKQKKSNLDLDFSAITSDISIVKLVTKRINKAKGTETRVTTALPLILAGNKVILAFHVSILPVAVSFQGSHIARL